MPKAQPSAVGHVIRAQELLSVAADELIKARLEIVRVSGDRTPEDDFRGTPLDRKMDTLSGRLTEDFYGLNNVVREVAALIEPVKEEEHGPG